MYHVISKCWQADTDRIFHRPLSRSWACTLYADPRQIPPDRHSNSVMLRCLLRPRCRVRPCVVHIFHIHHLERKKEQWIWVRDVEVCTLSMVLSRKTWSLNVNIPQNYLQKGENSDLYSPIFNILTLNLQIRHGCYSLPCCGSWIGHSSPQ